MRELPNQEKGFFESYTKLGAADAAVFLQAIRPGSEVFYETFCCNLKGFPVEFADASIRLSPRKRSRVAASIGKPSIVSTLSLLCFSPSSAMVRRVSRICRISPEKAFSAGLPQCLRWEPVCPRGLLHVFVLLLSIEESIQDGLVRRSMDSAHSEAKSEMNEWCTGF
jgi:hypothetical protein